MRYSDYDNINESLHNYFDDNKFLSHWRRVFLSVHVNPKQELHETLKKHEHPGYLNMINSRKYISDLKYVRQDLNTFLNLLTNLKRIYSEYKKGNYQDNKICKQLDENGVEIKDFDPTIKYCKTTVRDAITKRIKELKEKYPRESTEMYMEGSIINYNKYNI